MREQTNNLLINLHRWAFKQDENFTTESFVHLLNHLLVDEPKIAIRMLRKLTNDFLRFKVAEVINVQIIVQPITDLGRPDMEISIGSYIVFIEVKVEAEINEHQLKRYKNALKKYKDKKTKLIVLSKYPASSDLKIKPDLAVRWFQVADWLEKELRSDKIKPLSRFFIEQFIGWMNELNLVSDGFDFFAETKESQMKILKDFLKQSYNYVQKIKA
jgi:hypothetical protein